MVLGEGAWRDTWDVGRGEGCGDGGVEGYVGWGWGVGRGEGYGVVCVCRGGGYCKGDLDICTGQVQFVPSRCVCV